MRLLIGLLLILTACATRTTVPDRYSAKSEQGPVGSAKRTVVFFLIDGMGASTVERQLQENRIPNIQRHFLGREKKFLRAHSIFPALTYPNISSLLHEKPVHLTGTTGNTLISRGQVVSFESVTDRPKISEDMRGGTIFSRLNEKGGKTVSLDYGLGSDATVAADILDLKVGLALQMQDYLYLDQKRLDSLKLILTENPVSAWPEFIFIHLIGLDFLSHQYGPESSQALDYLSTLDDKLQDIFEILQAAEKNHHKVISMMSADHGFRPKVSQIFPIEEAVLKVDPKLKVLNEGRMAAVYSPVKPNRAQLSQWTSELFQHSDIDVVAFKKESQVRILSRKLDVSFDLKGPIKCQQNSVAISVNSGPGVCPEDLEPSIRDLFYPFFIQNLAYYFQAPKHPDLIVIPKAKVAFLTTEVGFHGGPTSEEVFIPLLLRNATLKNKGQVPAIWELLQFM